MANRHAHKKLRAAIRARMKSTGESYQKVRACLLASPLPHVDLVPFTWFGVPVTLATMESNGVAIALLVPSSRLWPRGYPYPLAPLRAAMRPRGVQ
jgi:hypothetical protein